MSKKKGNGQPPVPPKALPPVELGVKAVKVTVPVPADELPRDLTAEPAPQPDIELDLKCGDATLRVRLIGRNYRRLMKSAPPGAMAVIQGKLSGDGRSLVDAGMTIAPPRPTESAPASAPEATA